MSVSDLGKKEMNHYDPIGMECSRSCMTRVFYTVILGRRRRSTSGQAQAETGHCCRGEGRDGDVACDGGRWHSGDASLREDRVVAGSPKVDSCFVGGQLALLYTSDGLGIFRKRVDEEDCRGEEENEAAGRFGKVHRCLFMIHMAARL